MLDISKLLCGTASPADALRYQRRTEQLPADLLRFSLDKKPVVVWNLTRRCNLHCIHCYANAQDREFPGEINGEEAHALIDDLAEFGSPVVLFSGGEPLMRDDILELAEYAVKKGRRAVFSTNGTLITKQVAKKAMEIGLSYMGVSMDGLEETHDRFRGKKGAFEETIRGMRTARDAGMKVGLRFTITAKNAHHIGEIFDLVEEEDIPRLCFYHLVYSGRGSKMQKEDLSLEESREAVDLIFDRTMDLHRRGKPKEVLTVDNHTDGVYLYMRVKEEQPERADEVLEFLKWNGGNNSGVAIGDIDWDGNVHADQFWQHHSFGNVRERKFSEIWTDLSDPIMRGLKDRKKLLTGRCAQCQYLDICNGNLRVRAEAVHDDVWAPDPACYLTDEEIGIA